eukprot:7193752-Alexandrium_andersonii.AAC.1
MSLRGVAPGGAALVRGIWNTEAEVRQAAETLHVWLTQDVCVLRSVLALCGAGGALYSCQIQERVARSGIGA